jgi:hypothetical protein
MNIEIILHRASVPDNGKFIENNLDYIRQLIEDTNYIIEFDLWFFDKKLHLGHDREGAVPIKLSSPEYKTLDGILNSGRAFVHAKNLRALNFIKGIYPNTEVFSHDNEAWTFTSRGRRLVHLNCIWKDSIWNQPELWMNGELSSYKLRNMLRLLQDFNMLPSAILTKYPEAVRECLPVIYS